MSEKILKDVGKYCFTCTTRNQVVEHLAKDRSFIISVKEKVNYNWRQDMMQDIYLILLEMNESKILTLNDTGYLPFFVYGIIKNQITYTNTKTHKQYRNFFYSDVPSEESTLTEHIRDKEHEIALSNSERESDRLQQIYSAIESIQKEHPDFWYTTKLMYEYIGLGSYDVTGQLTYDQLSNFLSIKSASIKWQTDKFRTRVREEIKNKKDA